MNKPAISRRGAYYDLDISPHEFSTSWGFVLKFSSPKKLEIFKRERQKKLDFLEKYLNNLEELTGTNYREMSLIKYEDLKREIDLITYEEVMKRHGQGWLNEK